MTAFECAEATAITPVGDCDDTDAAADEVPCDGVDQDCDGREACFVGADHDGYPDSSQTVASTDTDGLDPGEGGVTDALVECDDADGDVYPGAFDPAGDGVDGVCDGVDPPTPAEDDTDKSGSATAGGPPSAWMWSAGASLVESARRRPRGNRTTPASTSSRYQAHDPHGGAYGAW